MQSDLQKLQLIKQRIIKTDEVLKILRNKQNEVTEINKKYETLLANYNEKCQEVTTTGKQDYYSGLRKSVENSIQKEYNTLRIKYEDLQKENEETVNKLHEKYQRVCEDLLAAEKQCQDKAKLITKLGNEVKVLKNRDDKSKPTKQSKKDNNLKTKIKELESEIEDLRLEKVNNEVRIKELEAEVKLKTIKSNEPKEKEENEAANRLHEENNELSVKLKKSIQENERCKQELSKSKLKISQLKEKIAAVSLELNLAATKRDNVSVGIQTEFSDSSSDASFDMFNLSEMTNIPNILSPFSVSDDTDDHFLDQQEVANDYNGSVPIVNITPPTPTIQDFPAFEKYNIENSSGIFKVSTLNDKLEERTKQRNTKTQRKSRTININSTNVNVNINGMNIKYSDNKDYEQSNRLTCNGTNDALETNENSSNKNYKSQMSNSTRLRTNKLKQKLIQKLKLSNNIYKKLLMDVISQVAGDRSSRVNSRVTTPKPAGYETEVESIDSGYSATIRNNEIDTSNGFSDINLHETEISIRNPSDVEKIAEIQKPPNKVTTKPNLRMKLTKQMNYKSGRCLNVFNTNKTKNGNVTNKPEHRINLRGRKRSADTTCNAPVKKRAVRVSASEATEDLLTAGEETNVPTERVGRKKSVDCNYPGNQEASDVVRAVKNGAVGSSVSEATDVPMERLGRKTSTDSVSHYSLRSSNVRLSTSENNEKTRGDCCQGDKSSETDKQSSDVEQCERLVIDEAFPAKTCTEDDNKQSVINKVKASLLAKKAKEQIKEARKSNFKKPTCLNRIPNTPKSPEPPDEAEEVEPLPPKIIPLNKPKNLTKAAAKEIFEQIINYSSDTSAVEEACRKLLLQEPNHIAKLILEQVAADYHDEPEPDKSDPRAPHLTFTQKTLLGLMIKLEKMDTQNLIIIHFLETAERYLLAQPELIGLAPVSRLYVAACKAKHDIHRLRRMCFDAAYYMGDMLMPFMYVVLSSWCEVIFMEEESKDHVLMGVLVYLMFQKRCEKPGYNTNNVRFILEKRYGFTDEKVKPEVIFMEILQKFKENPSKYLEYALAVFLKNQPSVWVHEQMEKHLKPILTNLENEALSNATVSLTAIVLNQFDVKTDATIMKDIEIWLKTVQQNYLQRRSNTM